ncbi:MAG: hypothetical protein AAGD13_13160 [Pseudomonadota bacterium]
MPAHCKVHADPGLLVTTLAGRVTVAEFREVYIDLRASPGFSPLFPEIMDFRLATSFEFDHTEMARLAKRVTGQNPDLEMRTAILTAPGVSYGMARVYQSYAQLGNVETVLLFDDPEEALAWIGFPEFQAAAFAICP